MTFRETTLGLLAGLAFGATAQAADIDHVLLISVDGLHALDVARYIEGHPNSAMAELSSHGITYSNARTRMTPSGPIRSSKSSRARVAAPHGRTSTRPTTWSMVRRARAWMISTRRKSPT
jgi:hypothetical protein